MKYELGHARNGLLQFVRHTAMLGNQAWLKSGVSITRDGQNPIADGICFDRLFRKTVAAIPALVALNRMLVVTQVYVQFRSEHCLHSFF